MKLTSIVLTTLVAVAFVEGAAIAEAAAEAVPDPQSCQPHCYRPWKACSKAKRDALALAEATAAALAAADPDSHPCHAPGSPCSVGKREALSHCGSDNADPTTRKPTNVARALLQIYIC